MNSSSLPDKKNIPFKKLIESDTIKNRFNEVLGANAPAFISSLLSIYNGDKKLQECNAWSILGAAGLAATLNLSITPTLGLAYIVPFKSKNGYQATFQIGYKGLIQLLHRTGKCQKLHAGKVFEGQIRDFNPITGEPILGAKLSDKVVGYVAYLRLNSGFDKMLYMSIPELRAYAEKYSRSYSFDKQSNSKSSPWSTDFDAMATKTVLKRLLRVWGDITSFGKDVSTALQADRAVVDKHSFTYVDNDDRVQCRNQLYLPDEQETVDIDNGELLQPTSSSEATTNESH